MRFYKIVQDALVFAVLFLPCILAPLCAAATNVQADHDAFQLEKDVEGTQSVTIHNKLVPEDEDSSMFYRWNQPLRFFSGSALATFSKFQNVGAKSTILLPSWEKIVAYANALLVVTEADLNKAARDFHIQQKIDDFRNTLSLVVSASGEMREHITELTQKGLTLDQISDELGAIFSDVIDQLQKAFPPLDQAPSHEERQKRIATVLDRAEHGFLQFARKHGMSESGLENLHDCFDQLKPLIHKLVVITGDLVEQHPILFSTLVCTGVVMLIPESWLLRPLLRMFGFGIDGPVKGSLAAWSQRWFFGAQVTKGSWFAIMQRAGMTGIHYVRPVLGAIGGVLGALLPCMLNRVREIRDSGVRFT